MSCSSPTPSAVAWSAAVASPWTPTKDDEEEETVSPSLDGYVPFGAKPARRPALRLLKHANKTTRPKANKAEKPSFGPSEPSAETRLLESLRATAAEPFDSNRPEHVRMLETLWNLGSLGPDFARVSPCWRTLGFARDDPSVDLKGCGALGLRQLAHFCARGGMQAALSADAFPDSPFPLAAASLNVTLALCYHLRLLPAAASSRPPCAEPILAHFLRFSQSMDPESALDLMHAECLRGLADLWTSMQRPGLTPLQFTEALHLFCDHLAEALAGAQPPWQASEVLMRLRAFEGGLGHDEIAAMGGDLCLGQAASSMFGGWFDDWSLW